MRLRRLGLERYGHFTDRQLEFDAGRPVSVVLGANEAGKTTALAAVTDALYGIELRTPYAFLHGRPAMRIAAAIDGTAGTLDFARLSRRNAPLVDTREAPLPDDALAPFLGAHDRAAFLDIFGLDQTRLRSGGRALIAGGGDLAEALTASAPGLTRIAELRDRLKESAAKIFNPGRRTASHSFYQALDRRGAADRRRREDELKVDEVKRLREEAEAARDDRQGAERAETEATLARNATATLLRAAKELRRLDEFVATREALGTVPPLPAGITPERFVREMRSRLTKLESLTTQAGHAARELAAAQQAREAITLDEAVLAFAEAIERLGDERASIASELRSLPNRRDEATAARAGLARIAAAIGLGEAEDMPGRLPGAPLLARADQLATRLGALEVRQAGMEEEGRTLAGRRTAMEAGDTVGTIEDPAPLRRRLAALDGAEGRENALRNAELKIAAARAELAERAERLGFGDAETLARLPLPPLAAAEAALRTLAEARATLATRERAVVDEEERLAQARARLATLNAGRPAPTEAAIAAAREARDALWREMKPLALGTRAAGMEDARRAAGFERARDEADRLADERQIETKRLAELARTEQDIAALTIARDTAQARRDAARAELDIQGDAWRALWGPSGLDPAPDVQAAEKLREAEAIRTARATLRREAMEADALRETAARDRRHYEALRADLALPALPDAPLAMRDLHDAIAEREATYRRSRERAGSLTALAAQESELARRRHESEAEAEMLAGDVAEVFPALAIRPEATAREARATLALWQEALPLNQQLATAEHRIAGITRDEAAFIGRVGALVAQLGAPTPDAPFAAARQLSTRLTDARRGRALADEAEAALTLRRAALDRAQAELTAAEATLAESAAPLLATTPGPLPDLLDRLERAAALDARLAEVHERLADIGGGRDEATLRAAIGGRDDEALARDLAAVETAQGEARTARDRAVERDTAARAALASLDARTGAASAAQEEQDAVAEIAEAIENFTRDHVAARLLTLAIERYRQQHQSPVVERASTLFAMLTGGRWEGIGVDYEQDPPRLAARREGHAIALDALSEGTADQLFLALRIAAIEEHARRASPLPFIADDIFVTFDEARTEAAFRVLAELGATTQVIVFTHHLHVAACAQRALGDKVGLIEL